MVYIVLCIFFVYLIIGALIGNKIDNRISDRHIFDMSDALETTTAEVFSCLFIAFWPVVFIMLLRYGWNDEIKTQARS